MGRISTYTVERGEEICRRLSTGETLADICRDEGMPSTRTVYDWKDANPEFAACFARARDEGFDAIAADCLRIADETEHDTLLTETGFKPNAEWIARSRLRVDTRLKLLAKWDPRRYGDKMTLAGDPDAPLKTDTTLDVSGLSTAALQELMRLRDAPKPE